MLFVFLILLDKHTVVAMPQCLLLVVSGMLLLDIAGMCSYRMLYLFGKRSD